MVSTSTAVVAICMIDARGWRKKRSGQGTGGRSASEFFYADLHNVSEN
jgi:hypothetical protein